MTWKKKIDSFSLFHNQTKLSLFSIQNIGQHKFSLIYSLIYYLDGRIFVMLMSFNRVLLLQVAILRVMSYMLHVKWLGYVLSYRVCQKIHFSTFGHVIFSWIGKNQNFSVETCLKLVCMHFRWVDQILKFYSLIIFYDCLVKYEYFI